MKELNHLTPYHNLNTKCIYYDIKFDSGGIDYERFIKIRDDILEFSPNEWYLLWYLLKNSVNDNYHWRINISFIIDDAKFNIQQVREYLTLLQKKKIIYTNKSDTSLIKVNSKDIININIGYNLNEYYPFPNKLFKPIPIDFIKIVLPTLTPNEWYIYCWLVIKYNYGYKNAHPTIRQMVKDLSLSNVTISNAIKSLHSNKYKLIEVEKSIYNNGTFANNRYYIILLERLEYIHYRVTNYKEVNSLLQSYPTEVTEKSIKWYQDNKKGLKIRKQQVKV